MITFEKFFEYIQKKGVSQNELMRKNIVSAKMLNSLKHNKSITTYSINRICNLLECKPEDILTYTPDEEEHK